MTRVERIREKLTTALAPAELAVRDDSHKHVGHPGARSGMGHFHVTIVTEQFRDLALLQRHRIIYDTLDDMMHTDIHALTLDARAPDQYPPRKSGDH